MIASQGKKIAIPYDLLIGADGVNSQVREKLGISCLCFGKALARAVVLPAILPFPQVCVDTLSVGPFHIRKISTPTRTILFLQTRSLSPQGFHLEQIVSALKICGWQLEADMVKHKEGIIFEILPVALRQATTFINRSRSALLIGDAAASTGFFQGTGVNMALQAIPILRNIKQNLDASTFICYNQKLKTLTNQLISDSRYLFEPL